MSKQLAFAILLIVACSLWQDAPAQAEMQILESNVAEFRVGARIADADQISLPAGGRVKVLILPANETKVFRGAAERNNSDIPFGGTRGVRGAPRN